jgi:hypothetical protein
VIVVEAGVADLVLDRAVLEDALAEEELDRGSGRGPLLVRPLLPRAPALVLPVLAVGDAAAGHGVLRALLGAVERLDDLGERVAGGGALGEPPARGGGASERRTSWKGKEKGVVVRALTHV